MKKLPICTSHHKKDGVFLKGFGDYIAPVLEKPVRDPTQLIAYRVPRGHVAPPMLQRVGVKWGSRKALSGSKK